MELEDKKLDFDATKHLAHQAKELKEDPAFQAAVLALRKQWHAQQMVAPDKKTIVALAYRMQVLEMIAAQLQVFINDYAWAEKRKH